MRSAAPSDARGSRRLLLTGDRSDAPLPPLAGRSRRLLRKTSLGLGGRAFRSHGDAVAARKSHWSARSDAARRAPSVLRIQRSGSDTEVSDRSLRVSGDPERGMLRFRRRPTRPLPPGGGREEVFIAEVQPASVTLPAWASRIVTSRCWPVAYLATMSRSAVSTSFMRETEAWASPSRKYPRVGE